MITRNEVRILFIVSKIMLSEHGVCCVAGGHCQKVYGNHGPSNNFRICSSGGGLELVQFKFPPMQLLRVPSIGPCGCTNVVVRVLGRSNVGGGSVPDTP